MLLAEPWADTGTSTGRLLIAVLGGLADVERDLIRTRTAEGRSRAQTTAWEKARFPASPSRFCVRERQATARLAKSFASPTDRVRKSKTARRRIFGNVSLDVPNHNH